VNQAEIIGKAESALKTAGFDVSERIFSRPSCFDIAVRKEDQLALIKTHENIGSISMLDALELKTLTQHLAAAPILICEKTRHRTMEDDTTYSRYGIYAITPLTLEDITIHGNNPLVDATPGGYYVRLNDEKLKQERQERGLSVGKLAEMTGISRRTIYGYEKGLARASVGAAYNLEYVLGTPLVQGTNIFQRPPKQGKGFLAAAKRIISMHHCLRSVEHKLSKLNVFVAHVRRAPFDFIAKSQENGINIVGGVADGKERNLERRVDEIVSVGKVINAQPILIAENEQRADNNNMTYIRRGELERIRDLNDLRSLL